jgi:FkbM family methyltransferase
MITRKIKNGFRRVRLTISKEISKILMGNPKSISFKDYLANNETAQQPFHFIQVGANDGVSYDFLYNFIKNKNNSKGIVIEPIRDYFEELKKNYAFNTAIVPIQLAVHGTLKIVNLYRLDKQKEHLAPNWAKGIASVYPNHHLKSNTRTDLIIKETVTADTFMNIYNQYWVELEPIDLIQIDVEGFDWQVIQLIDLKKVMPRLIKYEWVNLNYSEQRQAVQYLKSNNYTIYRDVEDIIAVNHFSRPPLINKS